MQRMHACKEFNEDAWLAYQNLTVFRASEKLFKDYWSDPGLRACFRTPIDWLRLSPSAWSVPMRRHYTHAKSIQVKRIWQQRCYLGMYSIQWRSFSNLDSESECHSCNCNLEVIAYAPNILLALRMRLHVGSACHTCRRLLWRSRQGVQLRLPGRKSSSLINLEHCWQKRLSPSSSKNAPSLKWMGHTLQQWQQGRYRQSH